jgi:hypothetical protein
VTGFNLPLTLTDSASTMKLKIYPTGEWKSTQLKDGEAALFNQTEIDKMYYIGIKPDAAHS